MIPAAARRARDRVRALVSALWGVRWVFVAVLVACGASAAPTTTSQRPATQARAGDTSALPTNGSAGPRLVSAWLDGTWKRDDSSITYNVVDGGNWSVEFHKLRGFYVAWTESDGGTRDITVSFENNSSSPSRSIATPLKNGAFDIEFDGHHIHVTPVGSSAIVELVGDPEHKQTMTRAPPLPAAPEIEDLDRKRSTASTRDGVDAWRKLIFNDTRMWDGEMFDDRGLGDMNGLNKYITKLLARGALDFEPVASGKSGIMGFTIGRYRVRARAGSVIESGTYATVWEFDSDDGWRIRFHVDNRAMHAEARRGP